MSRTAPFAGSIPRLLKDRNFSLVRCRWLPARGSARCDGGGVVPVTCSGPGGGGKGTGLYYHDDCPWSGAGQNLCIKLSRWKGRTAKLRVKPHESPEGDEHHGLDFTAEDLQRCASGAPEHNSARGGNLLNVLCPVLLSPLSRKRNSTCGLCICVTKHVSCIRDCVFFRRISFG